MRRRGGHLAAADIGLDPTGIAELQANLEESAAARGARVVAVTSAHRGDGRTSTVLALAASMATSRRRVVVVDVDVEHPELHLRSAVPRSPGLSDVVAGRVGPGEALRFVRLDPSLNGTSPGYYVLTAGAEVAGQPQSARTSALLAKLAGQADLVLLDAPPVRNADDGADLGALAAAAVVVVAARRTTARDLRSVGERLSDHDVMVVGTVLAVR